MRRFLANKLLILLLSTLLIVIFIVAGMIPGSPVNKILMPVSLVLNPIQKTVQGTGNTVSDFFSAINDGMAIKKENEELKAQVAALEYQVNQGEEAMRRWEELKDAFRIKDTFENYEIIGASILTREADEWFSVINIDIGMADGVNAQDKSFAVVDAKMNLVGRVMSTDLTSAKVLPLLHEGFSVSAKVNTINGAIVRVHGEALMKMDGLCKIDEIQPDVELAVGDELVTSGKGGLFPAGIPIGVIEEVNYESELNRYAMLRPYTEIGNLKDLFVMIPASDLEQTPDESLTGQTES